MTAPRKRSRGTYPTSDTVAGSRTGFNDSTAGAEAGKSRSVTFGSTTITFVDKSGSRPSNIKDFGLAPGALEAFKQRLAKPGVKLKVGRNVPLYHADRDDPNYLIRVLNGKRQRGIIRNGKFRVVG